MVARRLRVEYRSGKLNRMCRMTFAAVAVAAALSPLQAQQVPGRDLFHFPIGTLAEAPALATAAGGGFWNPATLALRNDSRLLASLSALDSPDEQGVSAQVGTLAYRVRSSVTAGLSVAQSSVSGILRTDTDPHSIGDAVPYHSTILSAIVAIAHGPATFGVALRRRSASVDDAGGVVTSADVGGTIDRPAGLPLRAAVSSFLMAPVHKIERASALAAIEAYLPVTASDVRAGVSYQHDQGSGDESFAYASARTSIFDIRGGIARQTGFGNVTTRLRLGVGLRYAEYLVGVAREEGTSGLQPSYQFLLTRVFK